MGASGARGEGRAVSMGERKSRIPSRANYCGNKGGSADASGSVPEWGDTGRDLRYGGERVGMGGGRYRRIPREKQRNPVRTQPTEIIA